MKTKDVARQYNVDELEFENFLRMNNKPGIKENLMGTIMIEDSLVDGYVKEFQKCKEDAAAQKAEKERLMAEAEAKKQQAMANMLITSGFSFEGYTITKYSGYISGDDAIQVNRGLDSFFTNTTDVGASLMASLVEIRRNALQELKEAAYDLGCNAVIGVDFDYLTLEPETANSHGGTTYLPYVFGVTANGNAVIIEKK
jgi:uncharacterized protein YbjQ (UPF0145 family)